MCEITIPNPAIGASYVLKSGLKIKILRFKKAKDRRDGNFYEVECPDGKIAVIQEQLLKRLELKQK